MERPRIDLTALDGGGLDPQDWETTRELGHRMVDDLVNWWSSVRERPAWQPMPAEAVARLEVPLPQRPLDAAAVYQEFQRIVLPYPTGNVHPRFFSHVMGTGTPLGAFADLLAAAMNVNAFGGNQAAGWLELQVLRWLNELVGFPPEASGLMLSGGSMANFLGLAVALRDRAGFDLRRQGLSRAPQPLRLYCSSETHNSIDKAADLLGLGAEGVCRLPADDAFRLPLDGLVEAIERDRKAGWKPFCVVGNAVTVGTGAVDPLDALADYCAREGLWFHVDGAIGAVARLCPEFAPALAGMERADSLAFDLHKWLYVPYEAGCVLIRDPQRHARAFATTTAYLAALEAGLSSGEIWLNQMGLQLSRGFKALKVWMSLKEHGVEGYRRAIRSNLAQARFLGEQIEAAPDLELLAPVTANIVCFRYAAPHRSEEERTHLNRRIVEQLQVRGIAVPSHTTVRGRFAIRAAITNHRTRRADLELLVSETRRLGREFDRPEEANPGLA